jgi:hypothetical protein
MGNPEKSSAGRWALKIPDYFQLFHLYCGSLDCLLWLLGYGETHCVVVGLKRSPLSLLRINEKLLERN